MHYSNHGGQCCGIRHIFGMGGQPDQKCYAINVLQEAKDYGYHSPISRHVSENKDATYPLELPEETRLERLDRYLKYDAALYPSGILEVVLITPYNHLNQEAWVPILEARGFGLVNTSLNSNTGNRVYIYHLRKAYGEIIEPNGILASLAKPKARPKPKPRPQPNPKAKELL